MLFCSSNGRHHIKMMEPVLLSLLKTASKQRLMLVLTATVLMSSPALGRQYTDQQFPSNKHQLLTPDASSGEDVLKELGVDIENEVPEHSVSAVQGSSVELPCNLTAPIRGDKVRLVLWFKNKSTSPLYTYDTRGKSHTEARHWSDDKVVSDRAFFKGDRDPGRLVLHDVEGNDEAVYKCRVDFKIAPTRISHVKLRVIVPSEKPRIFTVDDNREVRLKLGPYRMGDTVRLRCDALGGRPQPVVTWWRDHALMDDTFRTLGGYKVENELVIENLKRSDVHSILTCQAANNNISVPVSTSVKLDMHFGPMEVKILNKKEPISAGKLYDVHCQSVGARPPPIITWWMAEKQVRNNFKTVTSPDGNVTVSTLTLTPSVLDSGSQLVCRAGNARIPDSTLEDSWRLQIHYIPSSTLTLGSNLNASHIKEGDDVYFDCKVNASPAPYKITWKHNGRELSHNVGKRTIILDHSLVLQKVTKSESGVYTCTAHNSEGDGVSNSLKLNVRYKPFCKPGQVQVYGVAKHERIHVACEVVANPKQDLKFDWIFNSSSERIDLPSSMVQVSGTRSLAEHMPKTEMDCGSLVCWATNAIGRQESPCVFHLIPAGRPDPVTNCTVLNQTYSTLHVSCQPGFDGGLPQAFSMQVMDSKTHFTVANTTNMRRAAFTVTGLMPGTGYLVAITSSNSKGRSPAVSLHAFTTKLPDQLAESGESALTRVTGSFTVTPILATLLVVGGALVLVFLIISTYLCVRKRPEIRRKPGGSPLGSEGGGGGGPPQAPRGILINNTMPCNAAATEMTTNNSKTASTTSGCSSSGGGVVITTNSHLSASDYEDCVVVTRDPAAAAHEQSNPDLIPALSKDLSASEEDGGFGVCGEKTRYATLQRIRQSNPTPTSAAAVTSYPTCDSRGYQTMRNYRTNSVANSIPTISQEVTYAELTLPRNKGNYAQLQQRGSGQQEPSVIYARIDKRPPHPPHHAAAAGPQPVALPLPHSHPHQHGGNLLITASGNNGNGGGISPSSLMNTSIDSSSAASTSSKHHIVQGHIMESRMSSRSKRAQGQRSSSIEDEGFNSCSGCGSGGSSNGNGTGTDSPVTVVSGGGTIGSCSEGGCSSSGGGGGVVQMVRMTSSPHSSAEVTTTTRDTAHLVSDAASAGEGGARLPLLAGGGSPLPGGGSSGASSLSSSNAASPTTHQNNFSNHNQNSSSHNSSHNNQFQHHRHSHSQQPPPHHTLYSKLLSVSNNDVINNKSFSPLYRVDETSSSSDVIAASTPLLAGCKESHV